MLRVSLDRYLQSHNLTAYRLVKATEGRVARGSVYALARGEEVKRVDLETLGEVMGALKRLTGEDVTPNDLIEVVTPPPTEMDAETRAWMDSDLSRLGEIEPYDWGEGEQDEGEPVRIGPDGRVVVGR